jgi:AraC-like DNA-binding protein
MEDMQRVKAFVRSSFREIRSIRDIAKAFNISQETLRKDFVRVEKSRLSQFVTDARVEEMKRLLSTSDRHCREICLGVGFAREEVGERAFKRNVGMTMMEFRRERALRSAGAEKGTEKGIDGSSNDRFVLED